MEALSLMLYFRQIREIPVYLYNLGLCRFFFPFEILMYIHFPNIMDQTLWSFLSP